MGVNDLSGSTQHARFASGMEEMIAGFIAKAAAKVDPEQRGALVNERIKAAEKSVWMRGSGKSKLLYLIRVRQLVDAVLEPLKMQVGNATKGVETRAQSAELESSKHESSSERAGKRFQRRRRRREF